MGILIAIAIAIPPLAIFIIPFIVISILVGFGMRSAGGAFTEPIRADMNSGAERIAQAIERRNAEAWAAQWDDTIVDEDGNSYVNISGSVMLNDKEVNALLQFMLHDDDRVEANAFEMNEIPQNMLMLAELMNNMCECED